MFSGRLFRDMGFLNCVTMFITGLYLMIFHHTSAQEYVIQNNSFSNITHIAYYYDGSVERVYIGATNSLIQLKVSSNGSLVEEVNVRTGPKNDWVDCFLQNKSAVPENVNQILLVSKVDGLLISCGSVLDDVCQLRNLTNIADRFNSMAYCGILGDTNIYSALVKTTSSDQLAMIVGMADDEPSLSLRQVKPDSNFRLFDPSDPTGPLNQLTVRNNFKIYYRSSFSTETYFYILTNQKFALNSTGYISKIQRFCLANTSKNSLETVIDMKLGCTHPRTGETLTLLTSANLVPGNQGYNIIATFTNGQKPSDLDQFNLSAICVFSLDLIDRHFQHNLDECLDSSSGYPRSFTTSFYYWTSISHVNVCPPTSGFVGRSQCDVRLKGIIGLVGVTETVETVDLGNVTYAPAILSTKVNEDTVIFVSLSNGTILKYHFSGNHLILVDKIVVEEGVPLGRDFVLDFSQTHLICHTQTKVVRYPVENCSSKTTCEACLMSKDPYCGWCVLKQKCSRRENCSRNAQSNHWLPAVGSLCPRLEINPKYVVTQKLPIQMTLTANLLPYLNSSEKFICGFSGYKQQKNVAINYSNGTLTCQSPGTIPVITGYERIVHIRLFLNDTEVAINKEFKVVDCSKINSCKACVGRNPCVWCTYSIKCTRNHTTCVEPNSSIPSRDYTAYNDLESKQCPSVNQVYPTLVHNNRNQSFKFTGTSFPTPKNGCKYFCGSSVFSKEVPADWLNSTNIECQNKNVQTNLKDTKGEDDVRVTLIWRNSDQSDNFGFKKVTVYECSILGVDCSTCGSKNTPFNARDYGCKWCMDGCRYKAQPCPITPCPQPSIHMVTPNSTHPRGNVKVTITGKELGRGSSDVTAITLAGQPCVQQTSGFEVSTRVVCRTQVFDTSLEKTSYVEVTVQQKSSNKNISFQFLSPEITGIYPDKGPIAGGSLITISGQNLDIGSSRSVFLGHRDQFSTECRFLKMSAGEVFCKTSAIESPTVLPQIGITIDNSDFKTDFQFNYTENPQVLDITPRKSFLSGGRTINVTGTNLDSIQNPMILLRQGSSLCTKPELCKHDSKENSSLILCPSPPVDTFAWKECSSITGAENGDRRLRRSADPTVGFLMDDVASVRSLSGSKFRLVYFPDPVIDNLTENKEFKPETLFYISGSNLTVAARKEDVSVFVCNSSCVVTNLNNTNLVCTLPREACDQDTLPVLVRVGYADYPVGQLIRGIDLTIYLAVIIPCILGVAIIVILIGVFKYRRLKQKSLKDKSRLQNQYELLESQVRKEARQEYADFHQGIQLVTGDAVRAGVPYKALSYYTYSMLFPADPMSENHLLNKSQFNFEDTARKLDNFIANKFFLVTMLRTLEAEKKLSAREKSNLANLITVVFIDRLDYLKEIWMDLLKEHVSKAVDKKQHKQVMRRNETIVEKLVSNWLALCMYENIKGATGSSLFMLYKATEMLTDFGPADAVTGEAHYTLSEEKLLKESISSNQLNIRVLVNNEEYVCKVLDCDTISQCRRKFLSQIYTSAPASSRPASHQVDLEWHSGKNGRLILDDLDETSQGSGEWKQLNTLRHYNVMDNSVMALLFKEENEIDSDGIYANFAQSTGQLISESDINFNIDSKPWHLVKREDDASTETKPRKFPEIYLPRLMSTKVTLMEFLDPFMKAAFKADDIPITVKFLFDYFDKLAVDNGIQDTDTVHTWKSNTLPVRFWGSLLKAPQNAFDVIWPDMAEPSLEVLAQCLIDSCSLTELKMGKDSPASKLLFFKHVSGYREIVSQFYEDITSRQAVTQEELSQELYRLSAELRRTSLFNRQASLCDILKRIQNFSDSIISALDEDLTTKKLNLAQQLEEFLYDLSQS